MASATRAYKRYHTNIEIVKGQNALKIQEESLQAIEVVQARASGLCQGLKLYPSNVHRMLNKDLTRFKQGLSTPELSKRKKSCMCLQGKRTYPMSLAFHPAELFSGTKNDLHIYLLCALPYQVIQLFGTL